MAYGFCLKDNPHDSISLKLPYPFGDTLYTITHNNLVPENLLQAFCNAQDSSAREILSRGSKVTTRRRQYLGYHSLYNALCHKLVALGVGKNMKYASLSAKFAEIYRKSQQDLYMASIQRLVELMDEMATYRTIYARDILRQGRGKRRKMETDERMKRWLSIKIHQLRTSEGTDESVARQDGEEEEGLILTEHLEYIKNLVNLVYGQMNAWDSDWEDDAGVLDRHEELTCNDDLQVDINDVAMASALWEEESVGVYRFPDIKEVYAAAHDGKVQSPMDIDSRSGEEIDKVILMDDEIERVSWWNHSDLDPPDKEIY